MSHTGPQCNGKQTAGKRKTKKPNIKPQKPPHQPKKKPLAIFILAQKTVSSAGNIEKKHETPKTLSQKIYILENRLYVR